VKRGRITEQAVKVPLRQANTQALEERCIR
jgi:hypothetical protein